MPMSRSATPMNTGTTGRRRVFRMCRMMSAAGGSLFLQQHLHQAAVEVGRRLKHLGARRLLALAIVAGQVDQGRGRTSVAAYACSATTSM